ncbi:MAG: CDP-glycerol glycerophosphotransferase family protein [Blautia sp.]|nr:CDP-glycerol glycerophosphotransferase family protein [Blautia sp.]
MNIAKKTRKLLKTLPFVQSFQNQQTRNEKEKTEEETPIEPSVPELLIAETDKNKVWAFCAGQASDDFRGNPKFLFIYINKYRKDITAYWLCQSEETRDQVIAQGYSAYLEHSPEGQEVMELTGVLVAEQAKNTIPPAFQHVKYLNLYHGVGGKHIERATLDDNLAQILAKKYICHNSFYRDNQLFLVTSPVTENLFKSMCGIDDDKVIRAGYPRCCYQRYFERIATFDHDLLNRQGLPADTKLVVYAPTYRDASRSVFLEAFPFLDKVLDICKEKGYLFIFKMHPFLENDAHYILAKEKYKDCPNFYFWDNKDDFYEILDKIDLAIVDYSSIFTDMLDAGVPRFIRYVYDFDKYESTLTDPYDEITAGPKCFTFDSFLRVLADFDSTLLTNSEKDRINQHFWAYSGSDTFDKIIQQTLAFTPVKRERKNLYSFDIFDTLIARKVLEPVGIFYYVKGKMASCDIDFPRFLTDQYPEIRAFCEQNVRLYYQKTMASRHDMRKEIQFCEIFDRMKSLYGLSDQQIDLLKEWELEAEFENTIPVDENIRNCLELVRAGEEVVLISDMYLPKDFIQRMLAKVCPELTRLPLYLSSDLGWQKTTSMLYLEVYKNYNTQYDFHHWIHTGDTYHADYAMALSLGIIPRSVTRPEFNDYEKALVEYIGTYDAYLIAARMCRFRLTHPNARQQFTYEYISLYLIPYVEWALNEAIRRGDQTLYFISRDGYHLKRIADKLIEVNSYPIKTRYIYASRRTWRIPSFIREIDEDFWGTYGNFTDITDYTKFLKAAYLDDRKFHDLFPEFMNVNKETEFTKELKQSIIDALQSSDAYQELVLQKAAEERVSSQGYLEQEIDRNEQFSFVEYWGRGYTQDCFVRLWNHITRKEDPVTFYYARTILPTIGNSIRYNFSPNMGALIFIEAIFANLNYKSIESYNKIDGKYEPVFTPLECDMELLHSMEDYLPVFAEEYTKQQFLDRISLQHSLFDFALHYYHENPADPMYIQILAPLVDAPGIYGDKKEFAKEFTLDDITIFSEAIVKPENITKNRELSYARSTSIVQESYNALYQYDPNDPDSKPVLLNETEIRQNRKALNTLENERQFAEQLSYLYTKYCKTTDVKSFVAFCYKGNENPENDTAFQELFRCFTLNPEFELCSIALDKGIDKADEIAQKLSQSIAILYYQDLGQLSRLHVRKESKLIRLEDFAFHYPKKKKQKLVNKRKLDLLRQHADNSVLQISSDLMKPVVLEHHRMEYEPDNYITGCCQTDVLLNMEAQKKAKEKLVSLYPDAAEKTIVLYLPKFRYRSVEAMYMNVLNMRVLERELKEKYFFILHLQAGALKIDSFQLKLPGFSADCTEQMPLREQMLAADIIIGDFRDGIFEAPILNKPVFLTCNDKDTYDIKEKYFRYNDIMPGVPVESEMDLIEKLHKIKDYDYTSLANFRSKYLTYCDGHSSERVYQYVRSLVHSSLNNRPNA